MKFVFLYKGSNGPKTNEYMQSWMTWLQSHDLLKSGMQVKGGKVVSRETTEDYNGKLAGFSICEADSLEKAVEISKGCPGIQYGDKVTVLEELKMQ